MNASGWIRSFTLMLFVSTQCTASQYRCDAVVRDGKSNVISTMTGQFRVSGNSCTPGFDLPPFATSICSHETEHTFQISAAHVELNHEASAKAPFDDSRLSVQLIVPAAAGANSAEFTCYKLAALRTLNLRY